MTKPEAPTTAAGGFPVERMVRPQCWGFAMDFLGDPEASIVDAYVAGLETELERLRAVLERIGAMDPTTDSIEGYNEWGEADCFRQAQSATLMALGPNV